MKDTPGAHMDGQHGITGSFVLVTNWGPELPYGLEQGQDKAHRNKVND